MNEQRLTELELLDSALRFLGDRGALVVSSFGALRTVNLNADRVKDLAALLGWRAPAGRPADLYELHANGHVFKAPTYETIEHQPCDKCGEQFGARGVRPCTRA